MIPYIFVIAVIISLLSIAIIFKIGMSKIKKQPEQKDKVILQFLIGVALSDFIPILLVIYGFTQSTPVQNIEELYMPGMIILLATGIANFFIFLQSKVDVSEQIIGIVNYFTIFSLALTNAIPLISIIALILMLPA